MPIQVRNHQYTMNDKTNPIFLVNDNNESIIGIKRNIKGSICEIVTIQYIDTPVGTPIDVRSDYWEPGLALEFAVSYILRELAVGRSVRLIQINSTQGNSLCNRIQNTPTLNNYNIMRIGNTLEIR